MRRALPLLAVLVVLAAASYAGWWFYLARELRQGLPQWADARRAEGMDVTWQTVEVAGFPFSLRVRFTAAALAGARPLPYDLGSEEVVFTASPFDLRHWRFAAPRGATLAAPLQLTRIAAASLEGGLALGEDATAVSLNARELTGSDAAQGLRAETLEVTLSLPTRAPASHRDTAAKVTASVQKLQLPHPPPPLPPQLDTASLSASFLGALPPGPLERALAAWRDDGGTIELDQAHLVWGETMLDLGGTLALDEAMQPTGALTATIVGADRLVDAAVAGGLLQPRYAGFARSVLRAISAPQAGGKDALHVPLTVQNQRLFIGPATVAVLPRITWQ